MIDGETMAMRLPNEYALRVIHPTWGRMSWSQLGRADRGPATDQQRQGQAIEKAVRLGQDARRGLLLGESDHGHDDADGGRHRQRPR